jgi:hypothetical protein
MRFAKYLIVILFLLPVFASAQVSEFHCVIDTAGTTWDSVLVGGINLVKNIEFCNDGSVDLYVALRSDTTATSANIKKFLILKQGEKFTAEKVMFTNYVKIKAASSTCPYRVRITR